MDLTIINDKQLEKRNHWINEIITISGDFENDSDKVTDEISEEIKKEGVESFFGHLRLCGAIPERYGHDSSEEKLYSKYTDVVISKAYEIIGLTSIVLTERADAADVESVSGDYSFVGDAKAFRLSRTAKNQKDFKVQAMDSWKRGKPYAMVVCPIYQLPSRGSQIYEQATTRSVCIFSYSHLLVLVRFALINSPAEAKDLLHNVFKTIDASMPSKSASSYWQALNSTILGYNRVLNSIWKEEKQASIESIYVAKEEALQYLASERERIMKLSRSEAISEVINSMKIDNRMRAIRSVSYNGLLD